MIIIKNHLFFRLFIKNIFLPPDFTWLFIFKGFPLTLKNPPFKIGGFLPQIYTSTVKGKK